MPAAVSLDLEHAVPLRQSRTGQIEAAHAQSQVPGRGQEAAFISDERPAPPEESPVAAVEARLTADRMAADGEDDVPRAPRPKRAAIEPHTVRSPADRDTDLLVPHSGSPEPTTQQAEVTHTVRPQVVPGATVEAARLPQERTASPVMPKGWQHEQPAAQMETAPTIQVTIGRIEVRAVPPLVAPAQRQPKPAIMTLDEYLRQRNGGKP
jgi:hypothetical protein